MEANIGQLITLTSFTNAALSHQIKQLDTVICLLKQMSDHTCRLLNESHLQTGLETSISGDTHALASLYALTHTEAALVLQRDEALTRKSRPAVRRTSRQLRRASWRRARSLESSTGRRSSSSRRRRRSRTTTSRRCSESSLCREQQSLTGSGAALALSI
jgi:hypothetical protein